MLVEMCLTALLSGSLEFDGSNFDQVLDKNNEIVYKFSNRTVYLFPDKYNLIQLCNKKERFPIQAENAKEMKFNLISSIGDYQDKEGIK